MRSDRPLKHAVSVEQDDFAVHLRSVPLSTLLADAADFAKTLPGQHTLTTMIAAEMESGKSWVCVERVVAELGAGRRCVYVHFEECDPTDTVERLAGHPPTTLADYVRTHPDCLDHVRP